MEGAFVDTDIILDLLSFREPFYNAAAHLYLKPTRGIVSFMYTTIIF